MMLDFVIGFVALIVVWVTAKRLTVIHVDRYGGYPPSGWLFRRSDDPDLERGRRVLLVTIAVAVVIVMAIVASWIRR